MSTNLLAEQLASALQLRFFVVAVELMWSMVEQRPVMFAVERLVPLWLLPFGH